MQYKKQLLSVCSTFMIGGMALITTLRVDAAEQGVSNYPSMEVKARIKAGAVNEDDRSLGRDQSDGSTTLFAALQPKLLLNISKNWSGFAFAEFLTTNNIVDLNEDFSSDQSGDSVSMREAWIDYQGFGRYPGESFRLGLERLREPSSLWWDRETLLSRWRLDTTRLKATLGVGQRIDIVGSSETELAPLEQDRLRYFSSLDYQWRYSHWLGVKLMHSVDETDDINTYSSNDNFQRQYTWIGVNTNNNYQTTSDDLNFQYSVDLMALSGRAEHFDDNANIEDVEVNGWAVDIGLRKRFSFASPIFFGAHIAFASGGDNETDNNTYYQTGLHTNRNRFAGTRSILSRFGETARLDLSNIKIVSLYLTQLIGEEFEWSLIGHQFTRVDENQSIQVAGLSVTPLNGETEIGAELDLLFAFYHNAKRGVFANLSTKLRAGYFDAGEAYAHMVNDGNYRVSFSLEKQF